MRGPTFAATLAAAFSLALAACSRGVYDTIGTVDTATLRFVNATDQSVDVVNHGITVAENSGVGFGQVSNCIAVKPGDLELVFVRSGVSTALGGTFAPSLEAGHDYTVVAYAGAGGAVQYAVLPSEFTPAAGQAGVQVVNAAAGSASQDVYVGPPGASLGTAAASGVAAGSASAFFGVPGGAQRVRFADAGSSTVGLDAGSPSFTAGSNYTLVYAAPAAGSTAARAFLVTNCAI